MGAEAAEDLRHCVQSIMQNKLTYCASEEHAHTHKHTKWDYTVTTWVHNGSSCLVTGILWSFYWTVKDRWHLKWQSDVCFPHLNSAEMQRWCLPSLLDFTFADHFPSSSSAVALIEVLSVLQNGSIHWSSYSSANKVMKSAFGAIHLKREGDILLANF